MSERQDAVLSTWRSKKIWGALQRERTSCLFLCPLSILSQNKEGFKREKSALSENTKVSGHGNGNGREPILETWSTMWLKHWTNCSKIKRPNLKGHLSSVWITVLLWLWFESCRFGKVDIFILHQSVLFVCFLSEYTITAISIPRCRLQLLHMTTVNTSPYYITNCQQNLLRLIHTCLTRWFQMTSHQISPLIQHQSNTRINTSTQPGNTEMCPGRRYCLEIMCSYRAQSHMCMHFQENQHSEFERHQLKLKKMTLHKYRFSFFLSFLEKGSQWKSCAVKMITNMKKCCKDSRRFSLLAKWPKCIPLVSLPPPSPSPRCRESAGAERFSWIN